MMMFSTNSGFLSILQNISMLLLDFSAQDFRNFKVIFNTEEALI